MLSLFSGFDRLRGLLRSVEKAEKVNRAFLDEGYPSVVNIEGEGLVPSLNKDYRLDLSAPPRFVWFSLAEVYVQYLPQKVELTYDVRKGKITAVRSLNLPQE
jgi:hypothetical protein